jgi:hypothetical protein
MLKAVRFGILYLQGERRVSGNDETKYSVGVHLQVQERKMIYVFSVQDQDQSFQIHLPIAGDNMNAFQHPKPL